ncbi:MAG: response regulator, partial [Bacteroidota bacterium]
MSEKEMEEGNLGIGPPGQEDDDVLSLMIVDDEFLVRIGIRETIPWGEHGFFIAGEAENGEEGLELAKRIQPDIIITDIRMPNMDGLEFMSRLKEEGIDAKVIVLSGYDEFDYAREALKYGALAYLLKPIENHQLLETVRNAGQTIIKERELKKRYSDLEQEVSSIVRHQLIRAIEGVPVTLSADDLKRIDFPLRENKAIILIRMDDYELLRIQNFENLGKITQVISTMDAKIDGMRRSIVLEKNKDEWVIIIDLEQYSNMETIYGLCQDILRLIYRYSEL